MTASQIKNIKKPANSLPRLENAVAMAIMKGDKDAEAKAIQALQDAISKTDAKAFLS